MSPLPSPIPLRHRLARLLSSPASLLFGFVVLLILTCPGARGGGGEALGLVPAGSTVFAAQPDLASLDLTAPDLAKVQAKPAASRPLGRSTRFDRVTPSTARSATPAERPANPAESFRHTRSAVPLLVDPLLADAPRVSPTIRPMTGPPVGIRSRYPGEKR